MGLFDFFKPRKQKSAYDVLMENPLLRQQKELYDAFNQIAEATGCNTDELPNGYGEFGLSPTNPIPTNTIMGSYLYLSRLCTADGIRVENHRCGSMTSEVSKMPIDIYELSRADGVLLATIYISPYHKRNSERAPRGFRLSFPTPISPALGKPTQSRPRAKYQISAAIEDFHSFLALVGGRTTQRPEYALVKSSWPGLLHFLQPIVTGERLFSAEAMDYAAPRLQREQTSVTDERATERAIYFGVMSFTVIMFNNHRDRYPRIDINELAQRWLSQARKPMESLESYGTAITAAIPKIETLAKHFLIKYVEPNVTDNRKMNDALGWFATQFLSGVVLGQITDFLTLRDYYLEQTG